MACDFQKRPPIRTDKTDETPVQAHSSPEIQRNTPAEALTKLTKPRNQGEPMKYPHTRPAALAAMWERGTSRDEWEIIEEVRRTHRAGESVHAGLQRAFNEIMLTAAEHGKLPAKRRGRKATTDPREVPAAVAYLKAKRQGVGAHDAAEAAIKALPRGDRQIARYVNEHGQTAEGLIATEDAHEIAGQSRDDVTRAIARVRILETMEGLPANDADKAVRLLVRSEALEISWLDQFIDQMAGDARRAAYFAHLSAQTGEPVADYVADVRYTTESLRIDVWEMQARGVLLQRAAGLENDVTETNRRRLVELMSKARSPGDD